MRLKPIYRLLRLAALAAGLLAAASSCVFEYGEAPAVSGDTYRMSVTVFANFAPGTRSTRAVHADDKQEDGTAAENFIDFTADDFRIALFDNSGKYLLNIGGTGKWNVFPYASDNAVYRMECEVVFPDNVTKEEIDQLKESGFQVMVLANWRNAGGRYDNLFMPGGNPQNLAAIWKDNTHYNFPYRPVSGPGGVMRSWMPSTEEGAARQLIPMFGFAKASKFETRTSGGIFYSNAQIKMQRAVAKIEVLDNLVNQPSLRVSDVKMSAYNTVGRFIPDVDVNRNWDKVGEQVDMSSLPANPGLASDELTFVHDEAGKKWIAYVPEMALPKGSQDPGTGKWTFFENRPHLDVTIEADAALHDFYDGGIYTAHFAKYDANSEPTIPDESWNHILRNHIYRFSVNKVGLDVRLHLHVVPWSPDEEEIWDFTDHVTVSQELEWEENTYEILEEDRQNIFLKLDETILVGSFRIETPIHGRWYARLTPLGDAKPNAVSFVDKDGEVLNPSEGDPKACAEVSGMIDGNVQKLYIRPTSYGNDMESRFKLDFWVENLGTLISVPMPDGPFIIVRKANNIIQ